MNVKQLLLTVVIVVGAITGAYAYKKYYLSNMNCSTADAALALRMGMRELWAAHVIWTREYIVSAVADAADKDAVTERLLKNQRDIGAAIAPFYGQEAGDKLAALLKEHILLAAEVVAAAKANDSSKLKDADAKWHENARDMANFLSSANPNWSAAMLLNMFNDHLKLTTDEAVARIQGEWAKDIAAFDAIFVQAMKMADDLSEGIIKQFPDKV